MVPPSSRPPEDASEAPRPSLLAAEIGAGAAVLCLLAPVALMLMGLTGTSSRARPYQLGVLTLAALTGLYGLFLLTRTPRRVGIAALAFLAALFAMGMVGPAFVNFG